MWCGGCAGPGRWWARRGRSAGAVPSASSRCRDGASCRRSRWPGSASPPRPARSGQAERRPAPAAAAAGRCSRRPMSSRFSSPVSRSSTAENCPVTPIIARIAPGLRSAQVVPHHAGHPGVRRDQGGQDLDGRGLARAVRPEQGEDLALVDGQVDAVQDGLLPVRLAQAGRGHRGACRVLGRCVHATHARTLPQGQGQALVAIFYPDCGSSICRLMASAMAWYPASSGCR